VEGCARARCNEHIHLLDTGQPEDYTCNTKDSIAFKTRFPTDVTYTGNKEGGTKWNFLKENCGLLICEAL